jgi:hypothetical protein
MKASTHTLALEWIRCIKNRYTYLEGNTIGFSSDNSKLIELDNSICEIEEHSSYINMDTHRNIFKFSGMIKNSLLRKYFYEFLENKFDNSQNLMKFWEYSEDYFKGHPNSIYPFVSTLIIL